MMIPRIAHTAIATTRITNAPVHDGPPLENFITTGATYSPANAPIMNTSPCAKLMNRSTP